MKKTKKKMRCSERMGYCPLSCKTRFVLQPRWLEGDWFKEELYCKRVKCIAIEAAWLLKKMYCNTVYCIMTGCWADGHGIAMHSGVL